MNKFLCFACFASCVSSATIIPDENPVQNFTPIPSENQVQEQSQLSQQDLFDTIRKGVVTIRVTAHLILDKYTNDKQWFGSGFLVDSDSGLIVTNAHVVGPMSVSTYEVKFGNGKTAEAKLAYIDPMYDFAILTVNKKDIPLYTKELKISEDPISINTKIYAMGNSSRNEFSTYEGYVFDTESILWLKPFAEQSFQFSGLTIPGASGSPVFNSKAEVIGLLYGGKFVSGAALPISYVKPAIEKLKNKEHFHRYCCGLILNYESLQEAVEAQNIPEDLAAEYENLFPNSNNKIIYVSQKLSSFGAEKSEIMPGDIIWKVEDEVIGSNLKRIDEIVQEKEGKTLNLVVYRNGKKENIEIPTFELNASSKLRLLSFAGTTFFETTPEIKVHFGKNNSAVYIMDSEIGSPFMGISNPDHKLYPGAAFQITELDGKRISNLDDVADVIPSLFRKRVFNVKFIRLGLDSQECSITTKYSPEFAEAALYTFDSSEQKWNVKNIKNPNQE